MEIAWTDALGAASGGLSAFAALVAVVVAVRSERRSREVLKTQMYLTLRKGFHDVYSELGDLLGGSDPDAARRVARQAYWHHAFDEWYVSRLAPNELGDMWTNFFKTAVQSGYNQTPLKETLDELAQDPKSGFGFYAKDFIAELKRDKATS